MRSAAPSSSQPAVGAVAKSEAENRGSCGPGILQAPQHRSDERRPIVEPFQPVKDRFVRPREGLLIPLLKKPVSLEIVESLALLKKDDTPHEFGIHRPIPPVITGPHQVPARTLNRFIPDRSRSDRKVASIWCNVVTRRQRKQPWISTVAKEALQIVRRPECSILSRSKAKSSGTTSSLILNPSSGPLRLASLVRSR
jgi:hypothetical protein